jgi:hypothetical protein
MDPHQSKRDALRKAVNEFIQNVINYSTKSYNLALLRQRVDQLLSNDRDVELCMYDQFVCKIMFNEVFIKHYEQYIQQLIEGDLRYIDDLYKQCSNLNGLMEHDGGRKIIDKFNELCDLVTDRHSYLCVYYTVVKESDVELLDPCVFDMRMYFELFHNYFGGGYTRWGDIEGYLLGYKEGSSDYGIGDIMSDNPFNKWLEYKKVEVLMNGLYCMLVGQGVLF